MSWFRKFAGHGRDKRKKHKEQHFSLPNEPRREPISAAKSQWFDPKKFQIEPQKYVDPKSLVHPNMNVRQVYSLPDKAYKIWAEENEEKSHFFMTPFIDNVYKVHRPGKLTHRRGHVPIQEIAAWCKRAVAEGVTDAFVLLPDRDLNEYYGIYDHNNKLIKSGREIFFDVYDAYDIKIHQFPIQDFGVPQLSKMVSVCKDLKAANDQAAANNGKVVVHCSAGIGRTGLVTSCYLVYTNRLSEKDIDAVKMEKWTNKPLTDMQKKIWTDTEGQLDFIDLFAETKEQYEKVGKSLDDPEVIAEIKQKDIVRQQEFEKKEKERRERELREKDRGIVEYAPSVQTEYVAGETDIDDWWENYNNKTKRSKPTKGGMWAKNEKGEWYNIDEEAEKGNEFVGDDIPPDDYLPLWDKGQRAKLESLKRRQNKRNYLNKPLDISDSGHDEYYRRIVEFPVETMDDEEWVRRFGESYENMKKIAENEPNNEPHENSDKPKYNYLFVNDREKKPRTDFNSRYLTNTVTVTPVINGVYKGKRPGYPSRKRIDESIIDEYAEELVGKGITDVFVLLNDNEINTYYDNSLFGIYEQHGLKVHAHPIEDFSIPSIEQALAFCKDLDSVVSGGGNALVHCSAGLGRTGLMISCYQIYKGMKPSSFGQNLKQENFIREFAKEINIHYQI